LWIINSFVKFVRIQQGSEHLKLLVEKFYYSSGGGTSTLNSSQDILTGNEKRLRKQTLFLAAETDRTVLIEGQMSQQNTEKLESQVPKQHSLLCQLRTYKWLWLQGIQ